jgi:hypothetical protein
MKKFFFAICALAAVATACTPEVETSPAVSFETALPVVAGEVATFTITVADYSGTEAVTIPVTFGGDAVKGTDYEVSAEAFVWGGENPVTTIKVTTLNFDSSKKVSLALEIPEGWMQETILCQRCPCLPSLVMFLLRSQLSILQEMLMLRFRFWMI